MYSDWLDLVTCLWLDTETWYESGSAGPHALRLGDRDLPKREPGQQKTNVQLHLFTCQVCSAGRGEVQRTATNRTLLDVLTTFGEGWEGGFPLAAWKAINSLLLPSPAPVIFHLLLNNFKDMKVIKANPGRVRSHRLLCVQGCHFLAPYSATHLCGPIGAEHNPSQYSNEAPGSEWR